MGKKNKLKVDEIKSTIQKNECNNDIFLMVMVKNEKNHISVTMDSCKDFVKGFIFLDTGSTDGTQDVIKDYCNKNNVKLYFKQSEFINFRDSRNELIDFAETELSKNGYDNTKGNKSAPFFLLLDCSDQLQNGSNLISFVKINGHTIFGANLSQKWFNGHSIDTFYYPRFIKAYHGWKYHCVVHEYLDCELITSQKLQMIDKCPKVDNVVLYQDRTKDGGASAKRFSRDKEMLHAEYIKTPKEPRNLFYLAQTFACLYELENAYRYYKLRLNEPGFIEERFHSFLRLGAISKTLGHCKYESIRYFFNAISEFNRVEPCIELINMYYQVNDPHLTNTTWHVANLFASYIINLTYPDCILFVTRSNYDYDRWHLHSIISFYDHSIKKDKKHIDEFKNSCSMAIKHKNNPVDTKNLSIYNQLQLPDYQPMTFENIRFYNEPVKFESDQTNPRIKHQDEYDFWTLETLKHSFRDDLFYAYFKLGESSEALHHEWSESFMWYWKSFELLPRVEPLIKIAEHYISIQKHHTAYMLLSYACKLEYPRYATLVNKDDYEYKRFHLLSLCAFYYATLQTNNGNNYHCKDTSPSNALEIGKNMCLKACKVKMLPVDKNNLNLYLQYEKQNKYSKK